jgi:hypothetical protein
MSFAPIQHDIKFGHFPDSVEGKHTIAYRINDKTKTISYAVAYTHPNDAYNHKLGRQIAQGRLIKGGNYFNNVTFDAYKDSTGVELKHADIVRYLDMVRAITDIMLPTAARS